jgi:Tfp pilus assembly protein PilV
LGYLADVMKNLSSLSTAVGAPALGRSARSARRGLRQLGARGFTIAEVVMATLVLMISIGSTLVVLGRGFAALDSARCITYASQIMQSEFEKMRLTQWGDGNAAGTGHTGVTAYPTTPTIVPHDTSFFETGDIGSRMTMTRTAADVTSETGKMIMVKLTITWTTHDGRTVSRSYTTYYGKNGLYDYFSA